MLSMLADRSGAFGDLPRNGGLGDLGQAGPDLALGGNFAGMPGLLGGSLGGQLPRSTGMGTAGNPLGAQNAPQGNLVSAGSLGREARACRDPAAVLDETGCCLLPQGTSLVLLAGQLCVRASAGGA